VVSSGDGSLLDLGFRMVLNKEHVSAETDPDGNPATEFVPNGLDFAPFASLKAYIAGVKPGYR
jgi:hypothetical protein